MVVGGQEASRVGASGTLWAEQCIIRLWSFEETTISKMEYAELVPGILSEKARLLDWRGEPLNPRLKHKNGKWYALYTRPTRYDLCWAPIDDHVADNSVMTLKPSRFKSLLIDSELLLSIEPQLAARVATMIFTDFYGADNAWNLNLLPFPRVERPLQKLPWMLCVDRQGFLMSRADVLCQLAGVVKTSTLVGLIRTHDDRDFNCMGLYWSLFVNQDLPIRSYIMDATRAEELFRTSKRVGPEIAEKKAKIWRILLYLARCWKIYQFRLAFPFYDRCIFWMPLAEEEERALYYLRQTSRLNGNEELCHCIEDQEEMK